MIALQALLLCQVIIALSSPTAWAVPIYGTKKYTRSSAGKSHDFELWSPNFHQYRQSVQRHHPFYEYESNPYVPSYYDYYYRPRDLSLMYYPKTSKYEVYQAVVPYYYNTNSHGMYPNYLYDYSQTSDPILNAEDQDDTYYDNNESSDNMDAVNTAFLNNLIMTQIYNDAMDQKTSYHKPQNNYYHDDHDVYGTWEEFPVSTPGYFPADEIEREMKGLGNYAEPTQAVNKEDRLNFFNKGSHPSKKMETKRVVATTSKPILNNKKWSGQKEEVLHQPAIHRKFEYPTSNLNNNNNNKQSVYDIIKHMLTMEKELDSHNADSSSPGRKTVTPSEDSLTRQLTLLKDN
ncbi:uncharacterized protein [Onthophagus taurus]|uniref:uncharacterized protein n=1 Tax=Onthophagus taurus TaxID=166361 RepID=UPI000C20118B|nr:uncharacterized protein LOC111416734 [Onthophagus taurus]